MSLALGYRHTISFKELSPDINSRVGEDRTHHAKASNALPPFSFPWSLLEKTNTSKTYFVWTAGLEPACSGSSGPRLNLLSYVHVLAGDLNPI